MIFAETSFLVASYREQENSPLADEWVGGLPQGSPLSPLVVFEFENTLQLQVGLFHTNRARGFPKHIADQAFADFRSDLDAGFWRMAPLDFPLVLAEAGKLSRAHTAECLLRAMDVLHVASARHLGAKTFLTFDSRQARLAKAAGMKCPLKVK
jgi:predicted nucleic acid-binding protein